MTVALNVKKAVKSIVDAKMVIQGWWRLQKGWEGSCRRQAGSRECEKGCKSPKDAKKAVNTAKEVKMVLKAAADVVYDRNHLFGLGSDTETETGNWPKL